MNEDIRRFFTWNMKKLVILDFGIFSIQTGLASFELSIMIFVFPFLALITTCLGIGLSFCQKSI